MKKVEQLSWKALSLYHHREKDYYISSWQRSDSLVPMLIVRFIETILSVGVFVWSLLTVDQFYMIYLTNWGLILITLMTLSGLLVSLTGIFNGIPENGESSLVHIFWLLYNLSASCAFLITIFYWILLYDVSAEPDLSSNAFWLDIGTHGLNSLIVLIELVVSRNPCRFIHFYQPLGLACIYTVFSVIYYAAGGVDEMGNAYVYDVLDWSKPGPTMILVAITAVGVIGLHIFHYFVAWTRNKISSSCVRNNDLPKKYTVNYA